ncbi:hypothetical protein ASPTUDRAFT_134297 [Aspergillus tubingensis CBS 134.48]|uniref:Uncharacterized protein n=1 Tax=Aspergillus tubingensis (strain CBS 134.48) TaxID=767770 RepID=A0A1L9NIZ6_ASPTC|nr:hypothetical protein ASPTUDRAFT_134297 [Aspergillus tubingensis CBS 134.48]
MQGQIAICGVAMRLPGGIQSPDAFWDLLEHGRDARGPVPLSRYNLEGFDDSLEGKETIKTRFGYFIEDDLTTLDASFFSLTKNELEKCDPQQRKLLEVTRECLEDAGEVNYRGERIGCYVGTFGEDWLQMSAKESQHSGGYIMTGHGDLMIANRVSYEYDFHGPSLVIKTGCSASLVALHEACRALQTGDATGAIVAGTNLIMGPTTTAAMTAEGILSPEGSCKTFDAKADGFARAEAITAVYIKPLAAAIRDGNVIRAVIRATGSNSDGKSQSLMSPNGAAHEALMRQVYEDAGLDPAETAYVECHGTGTPTGDPIETTAVGNVFGQKGVFIGSVKPNIGHSEGSSGISSLIKAVLALEHNIIPPNIKFNNPNPKVPFAEKQLKVPLVATPWPDDRARRISINSFGIGGANAHVIVDAFVRDATQLTAEETKPKPTLLVFSANTQSSLTQKIEQFQQCVPESPQLAYDFAYTLALHREHLPYRAFGIWDHGAFSETSGLAKVPSRVPEVTMIFSGQGAQWAQMGKDLLETDVEFRRDIHAMDEVLQSFAYPPNWSISDELQKSKESSQINRAELSQPLCTAIQIALVNRFLAAGIEPSAVIGHSSGEIAAAYAAGIITMEAAMIIAYYRGYVANTMAPSNGAMAAIGLGASEVSQFLVDAVTVACENSPSSTTISGDADKVDAVLSAVETAASDVLARKLVVNIAYHSHHMRSLAGQYFELVKSEMARHPRLTPASSPSRSKADFISSVTATRLEDPAMFLLGPDYWVGNLTSPVLFARAVTTHLQSSTQDGLFLEIGPHSTLAGPLRQITAAASRPCVYAAAMIRNENCAHSLLSAFGRLFQEGVRVDFSSPSLMGSGGKALSGLPTYPWDHKSSYWYESRVSQAWRLRKFAHHCLLGSRVPETPDMEPLWRNVLHLEHEPWLADHKIRRDVVFPFAGYIAMAGEAVRQISGADNGFSIRHVVAQSALVLVESKPVEMMTALHPRMMTDSDDGEWFDFVIMSYSNDTWTKHCKGQIKPLGEEVISSSRPSPDGLPRQVEPARFYEAMANVGIVYGPEFQGLTNINCSPTDGLATADIVRETPGSNGSRSPFFIHPSSIDACLQLLLVAMARGLGRNFNQLSVPTVIEELEVARGANVMQAIAWQPSQLQRSGVECLVEGKTVFRMAGLQLTPLDDDGLADESSQDVHAAARLEWFPDFDFMDVGSLFQAPVSDRNETRLQEEMTLLCVLDTAAKVAGCQPCQPHFAQFRNWLQLEVARAERGEYALVEDCQSYVSLSPEKRQEMIQDRYERLLQMNKRAVAISLMRICDNAEAIFTGQADTLDILMQDNVLTELYDVVSFGHSDFVRFLCNTRPTLRILEVGAGTGGTTELILRDLVDDGGLPLYSTYTFTDVSAGFFPQAKERFAYAVNMEYKVFDISQDYAEQGFEPGTYDLIFAANVIHATPVLQDTLRNLQPLLRADGMLVMTELCAVVRAPNYIFGNFSGWWLGEADNRPHEPYVPVDRWDVELKAAGFAGVDTVVYDEEEPYRYCAAILSKPASKSALEGCPEPKVAILAAHLDTGIAPSLVAGLRRSGYVVSTCQLGDALPEDHDIISCLDLETNFFEDISAERFAAFQTLLRSISTQKILWLTKPVQIHCQDPRSAQTIGVARTIRSELAMPFFTLEIDPAEDRFTDLVSQVFNKIRPKEDHNELASDKEFAVHEGTICVGRYHPFSLTTELCEKSSENITTTKTLQIGRPGLLETLKWVDQGLPEVLQPDQVAIKTRAIGLNFRDIVFAMGIIPAGADGKVPLGLEAAGIIQRVGSEVQGLSPGDRVMALAPHGCITTDAILPASLVVRIPDHLSFEEAATLPICFVTALRGLIDIGRLEKGQTVLIHSAAGGVGIAAIQIARLLGAEIFATVSTEEKTRYLVDQWGIPRSHIFYSRDQSFVADLMHATGGRGVDLVLNSLSGELLHASWKCVAEYGMLVELGKRDLVQSGQLDMRPFLANRSYSCVDISQFIRERPGLMGGMLTRLNGLMKLGLQPITPITTFSGEDSGQAFRYLQQGTHIGKVVLSMPEDTSSIPSSLSPRRISFDGTATYLLAGGLGGLGRSLAIWLVESGARHLTFLSRSAGISEQSKQLFQELKAMGCSVHAVAGGVDKMDDVKKAISLSKAPIKGVFQLAMVLDDAPILDMSWSAWQTATRPKVQGTWNLHEAFQTHSLDFFWLASSLVTVVDQPGQGNYNAANTFLEAFCQYRHQQGLPASVLNICPIDGVGFVAENPIARRNMKAQGLYFLGEREFLDYVELGLLNSHTTLTPAGSGAPSSSPSISPPAAWKNPGQILMGLRSELDLDDPNNRTNWRRDRRMGIYHNVHAEASSEEGTDANTIKAFLARAADDPSLLTTVENVYLLAEEIGHKIYDFMLKPDEEVDPSLSLQQMGLDSLMAIELRRWVRQTMGLEFSVLEMMGMGSLIKLAESIAQSLQVKYES